MRCPLEFGLTRALSAEVTLHADDQILGASRRRPQMRACQDPALREVSRPSPPKDQSCSQTSPPRRIQRLPRAGVHGLRQGWGKRARSVRGRQSKVCRNRPRIARLLSESLVHRCVLVCVQMDAMLSSNPACPIIGRLYRIRVAFGFISSNCAVPPTNLGHVWSSLG